MGHKQEYLVVFRLLLLQFFLATIHPHLPCLSPEPQGHEFSSHVSLLHLASTSPSFFMLAWSPWQPQAAPQTAGRAGWLKLADRSDQRLRRPWRALGNASSVIIEAEMKNVINWRYSDYWSKSQEDSSSICTLQLLVFPSPQASSMGGFTLLVDAWI